MAYSAYQGDNPVLPDTRASTRRTPTTCSSTAEDWFVAGPQPGAPAPATLAQPGPRLRPTRQDDPCKPERLVGVEAGVDARTARPSAYNGRLDDHTSCICAGQRRRVRAPGCSSSRAGMRHQVVRLDRRLVAAPPPPPCPTPRSARMPCSSRLLISWTDLAGHGVPRSLDEPGRHDAAPTSSARVDARSIPAHRRQLEQGPQPSSCSWATCPHDTTTTPATGRPPRPGQHVPRALHARRARPRPQPPHRWSTARRARKQIFLRRPTARSCS